MNSVLLVVPPFQGTKTPALGVSQLKANLQERSIPCEVLYLNLLFADRIGPALYDRISNKTTTLLGDFVFSHLLFEHPPNAIERYVDDVLSSDDLGGGGVGAGHTETRDPRSGAQPRRRHVS